MGSQVDETAERVKKEPETLERFIVDYERFILASASEISKCYVDKSSDEWSIALGAFYSAVQTYDKSKGGFLSYAKRYIRSRMIDFFRMQGKHRTEVSLDVLVENEKEAEIDPVGADLREEIEALGQELKRYGISYRELAACSPKATKTKAACGRVIRYLLESSLLMGEIRRKKELPMKTIEKNTQVPRKIIERHRKYIVSAVEILSGEYPGLSEYLAYVWMEG